MAYMGDLKSAAPFFDSIGHPCPAFFNPADHYIHKLSMTPRQVQTYKHINYYIIGLQSHNFSGELISQEKVTVLALC